MTPDSRDREEPDCTCDWTYLMRGEGHLPECPYPDYRDQPSPSAVPEARGRRNRPALEGSGLRAITSPVTDGAVARARDALAAALGKVRWWEEFGTSDRELAEAVLRAEPRLSIDRIALPPSAPEDIEGLAQVVVRSRGATTAVEASKTAGVSRSFWCDVEKGRRLPSRVVLARMCGAVVGNWNEWLVAWADARLDGSLADLRAALASSPVAPTEGLDR